MENDYRIETLADTFAKHAEEAEKHQKALIKMFLENNPESELPGHMKDPFNVTTALSVMAKEIHELKKYVEDLKKCITFKN